MEAFVGGIGLQWQVYKEYIIREVGGELGIIPDFDNGIAKTYNPNRPEEKKTNKRRLSVLFAFEKVKKTQEDVIKFAKEYGLLWTDRKKIIANEICGESIEYIYDEIEAVKKSLEIYRAARKGDFEKLKSLIKLIDKSEFNKQFYEVRIGRNILNTTKEEYRTVVAKVGIKKEPVIQFDLEKNAKIDLTVYNYITFCYLAELVTDKIEINGCAIPYYSKIISSDASPFSYTFIPTLECRNLATAIWIQLYNILTLGQKTRVCKNEYCQAIFRRKGKTAYCSPQCKRNKNMRDYWERVNNKKLKDSG